MVIAVFRQAIQWDRRLVQKRLIQQKTGRLNTNFTKGLIVSFKSIFRGLTVVLIIALGLLLAACGSGSSSNSGGSISSILGAGVKAPLSGAAVRLFQVDLAQTDLKGILLDEGHTDSQAAVNGLTIRSNLTGLVLLEFVADEDTVEINTNKAPVLDRLVTVFNVQRVYDGQHIYASPLTTMAVELARKKADTPAPYAGNNDDVTSEPEFIAALDTAQNQVKSTLGFGLDNTVDIFVVPPMLTEETDTTEEQIDVVRYRQAIEAVAAVANEIAQDSTSVDDSAQEILTALAEDLSDGVIDGQSEDGPIDVLAALDTPIDDTLANLDLNTLNIPGTDRPISDIEDELVEETASTGEVTDTEELENDTIDVDMEMPNLNTDIDGDGVDDSSDAFPTDPTETADSDNDGVGDNADAFPNDATETEDSDNDGVGDNGDAFPDDVTEWADSDTDGVGDNSDAFPDDATEWADSDNDGVGDNTDDYPNDPAKSIALDAEAMPSSVRLTWDEVSGKGYNLYYSTAPDCDIANYASCPDGTRVENVTSPHVVSDLINGQNYWFQIESVVKKASAFARFSVFSNVNPISNEEGARPDHLITDGSVSSLAQDASGVTYIGGNFTYVGMRSSYGVTLSASTGHTGAFPAVNGIVLVAVPDGTGGFYIGGDFTEVDDLPRNRLAHVLANGTLGSWNPDANGTVSAIAVLGDTVYVGGSFTTIDDGNGVQIRNRLAAIGTDGTLGSWDPDADNSVSTLVVAGSTIYAGGNFTTVGSEGRGRIAAIGTDGTLYNTTPYANSNVRALAVSGNTIYMGGGFSQINGQTRNRLAAITTDGTLTSWNPNSNGAVKALAVSDNIVYAGGSFSTIGGESRLSLAAIGTNGTLSSWDPQVAGLSVDVLAVSGDTVYMGGWIVSVGGVERENLAAIGTDGTLSSWKPDPAGAIYALAISGDTVYTGGDFAIIGAEARSRLAAINADGTLNTAWNPGANGSVSALAVSDSTVYAGGNFTTVGSDTRNYLAAIGTDGTLSTLWNPNPNGRVNALAVSGSTVYAGGEFTTIGGDTRNHLAAIDTDGTLNVWNPDADDNVDALAISGSTVYVGGWFNNIGGNGRDYLAAIETNGTLGSWAPSLGSDIFWWSVSKAVSSIVVSGSTVYVGGGFNSVDDGFGGGPQVRNYLAAIGTDGTLASWNPDANDGVNVLAISGTTVYAGGDFTAIGSAGRSCLAAIGTDGTLTSWNPGTNGSVWALAVSGDKVYAGGTFLTADDEFSPYLAILAP